MCSYGRWLADSLSSSPAHPLGDLYRLVYKNSNYPFADSSYEQLKSSFEDATNHGDTENKEEER